LEERRAKGEVLLRERQQQKFVRCFMAEVMLIIFRILCTGLFLSEYGAPFKDTVQYGSMIFSECSYLPDVEQIIILAYYESRFDERAVSKADALGLMQLHYSVYKKQKYSREELFEPVLNIILACQQIKYWQDRFGPNWLCHYNAGNKCTQDSLRFERAIRGMYKKYLKKYRHMLAFLKIS